MITSRANIGIILLALLLVAALIGFFSSLERPSPAAGEPITINGITVPPVPTLNPALVAQGEELYAQYCANCHGADLEGQSDWKQAGPDGKLLPPPHDSSGHTWHHADDLLLAIIANGGDPAYSTMPVFMDVLSDAEMRAVLTFIKTSWGQEEREFQWWITVRGKQ